jgi:predicted nucleotidyltransferase
MNKVSREEIKRLIIETLRPFGVKRIALFGSFARNEHGPQSDVDILVRLDKSKKCKPMGLEWFTLDQEISMKIGAPVDLVSEDAVPESLRRFIENDLEVIYEKAG